MGKKIWYSTPLKFYWDELYRGQKKLTPNIPDQEIFHMLRHNIINAPLRENESQEARMLMVSGLELWNEDNAGNFLHLFFIDKELRDFLQRTPLSDLEGIREYLYIHGGNKKIIYSETKTQVNCVAYNFGLHIPYERDGHAFSLILFEDKSIELYYNRGPYSGRILAIHFKELAKKTDQQSIHISNAFRLAINTIAYMKCFPECVSEGVPKITKDRDESRSNTNFTLQTSENIIEANSNQRSKTPHFRKGFFRLLKSDFYKNKKGELVYVSETMVKGKAKTIETSDNKDELPKISKKTL